jgi:hypothetical protein
MSLPTKGKLMTNTNYTDYPFTANGINFISRISNTSPFVGMLKNVPAEEFTQMNIQAVTELIGDASLLTTAELLAELERVNEGSTHSWILLGAN